MGENFDIPKTVGEFIALLKKYPSNAELSIQITEIYDNGSIYPTSSDKMNVGYWADNEPNYVELTFGNGHYLP